MKIYRAVFMSGLLLVAGCVSLEVAAPPVDEAIIAAGDDRGVGQTTLERGREIYVNQCMKCHYALPIHNYDKNKWGQILPKMSKRAKLDPAQQADVKDYVYSVLAAGQ